MSRYRLVIGNKNYSSWSLRPWLFMRHHALDFQEVRLALDSEEFRSQIGRYSPTGKVPVLHDGGLVVWDSLAILDYLAEQHPDTGGWPADTEARAHARSIACEMHSGFADRRGELPMNCRRRSAPPALGNGARRDIDRVQSIWSETRRRYGNGGDFLFGAFSIADAMYAPVASRFTSYGIEVDDGARRYIDALFALPALQAWMQDAVAEGESLAKYEAVGR